MEHLKTSKMVGKQSSKSILAKVKTPICMAMDMNKSWFQRKSCCFEEYFTAICYLDAVLLLLAVESQFELLRVDVETSHKN